MAKRNGECSIPTAERATWSHDDTVEAGFPGGVYAVLYRPEHDAAPAVKEEGLWPPHNTDLLANGTDVDTWQDAPDGEQAGPIKGFEIWQQSLAQLATKRKAEGEKGVGADADIESLGDEKDSAGEKCDAEGDGSEGGCLDEKDQAPGDMVRLLGADCYRDPVTADCGDGPLPAAAVAPALKVPVATAKAPSSPEAQAVQASAPPASPAAVPVTTAAACAGAPWGVPQYAQAVTACLPKATSAPAPIPKAQLAQLPPALPTAWPAPVSTAALPPAQVSAAAPSLPRAQPAPPAATAVTAATAPTQQLPLPQLGPPVAAPAPAVVCSVAATSPAAAQPLPAALPVRVPQQRALPTALPDAVAAAAPGMAAEAAALKSSAAGALPAAWPPAAGAFEVMRKQIQVNAQLLAANAAATHQYPAFSLQDTPGRAVVVYMVGALVREEESPDSTEVITLPMGTQCTIAELRGRRARITTPVEGWLSVSTSSGDTIMSPLLKASPQHAAVKGMDGSAEFVCPICGLVNFTGCGTCTRCTGNTA
eukprot:TRINITY_DN47364_c0_g1_i1.p1 TRINITY_DN47364_c0_g1~~TRINITY_DN47364_c0_g1_i1.p1  ORF type:complete len:536 (+),score=86.68 TRINITY_DN47364_c0_g1_i1:109-1716(+)